MNYNYFVEISSSFFLVFLIGTTLSSTVENIMDWLNSNKGDIGKKLKELYHIHPLMKKFFSRGRITKADRYNTESQSFSDLHSSISSGISVLIFLCGISPFLLHMVMKMLPSAPITIHYIVFFIFASFIKCLCDIPFSWYDIFHIETKYGFNTMTKGLFIVDTIKSFVLNMVFMSIIIFVMNYVLTTFGPFSAYKVCAFVTGSIIVGMIFEFLYMTVLIRLFNKLTPLKDKKLVTKISKLLKSYGYKTSDVYVMDASKRSKKSNAFIGGIGKSKKIVLFDTLLKNYTHDELIAILGHELAHGKLNHLLLNRIISASVMLVSAFVIFSMAYNINLYHAFGFYWITNENLMQYTMIGFGLASMVVGSVKWILSPIEAYISRKCEYAADKYSVYYTKKKEAMISSLIKLTSENCGDVFPNKYYEAYNYGHPSLVNRINAIKSIKITKKGGKKK